MTCVVLFFAAARQQTGVGRANVELPMGATVAQLRETLLETFPKLSAILPHSRFAIDNEYVDDRYVIVDALGCQNSGAKAKEIALIPPVSGG